MKEVKSVSLTDIIMESWKGSRVYQLKPMAKKRQYNATPRDRIDEDNVEEQDELIIEIQIKMLEYDGALSRLVIIRNVNYIIEQ